MTRQKVFKVIIGTIAGLFVGLSATAFAHNMGYGGNFGPAMRGGAPCPWNTTAQGAHGPMHNQAFHQQMHGKTEMMFIPEQAFFQWDATTS